jgi:hypothetical protein
MSALNNGNHGRFYRYRIAWKYICPGSTKYLAMQKKKKKKNKKKNESDKAMTRTHILKNNSENFIIVSMLLCLLLLYSSFFSVDTWFLLKGFTLMLLSMFPIPMLVFIIFGRTTGLLKTSVFVSLSLKLVSIILCALMVNFVGITSMIMVMVTLSSLVDGWENLQWLLDSGHLCIDILHCDLKLCWWFLWWIVDTPHPVIFTNRNMSFNHHVFSFFHTHACWLMKGIGPMYMFSNGSDNATVESPEERKRRLARERKRKSRVSFISKAR